MLEEKTSQIKSNHGSDEYAGEQSRCVQLQWCEADISALKTRRLECERMVAQGVGRGGGQSVGSTCVWTHMLSGCGWDTLSCSGGRPQRVK